MAKSYEEILSMINKPDATNEELIRTLQPNPIENIGNRLSNIGSIMLGQAPQPQEDSAKDLIKAMVLSKIKQQSATPKYMKVGNQIVGIDQATGAVTPISETAETGLEKAKREKLETEQKFLSGIMGGQGAVSGIGELPPGTTMKAGPYTIPVSRKYTGEEAKALSSAEALGTDISDLKNLMQTEENLPLIKKGQFLGGGLFTAGPLEGIGEQGQRFAVLKKNIGERILRLRSGAQINESEYKRFMSMLPTLFRNDKIDIEQLDKFQKEFMGIQGRIQSGATWDKNKKQFIGTNSMENTGQVMDKTGADDEYLRYLSAIGAK